MRDWNEEIQGGIRDMVYMLVEFLATLLAAPGPVPSNLMHVLRDALDPTSVYNTKNSQASPDPRWEEPGKEACNFAVPNMGRLPRGRVVDAVNAFAEAGGFAAIQHRLDEPEKLSTEELMALLDPLSVAAAFLKREKAAPVLEPGIKAAFAHVQGLSEAELKTTSGSSGAELLQSLYRLSKGLWLDHPSPAELIDASLAFLLRLLRSAHFGARMHALKVVGQLLEGLTEPRKSGGENEMVAELRAEQMDAWLDENAVLSLALEGNIDQQQYCERLKTLLSFVGPRLKASEISRIWGLRRGRASVAVENIYNMLGQAAAKFKEAEIAHLLGLIEKSWPQEAEEGKTRALRLLGVIGCETANEATVARVADFLWILTHKPDTPRSLISFGWGQQLEAINKARIDSLRRRYIQEALHDLQEGFLVTLALWHIRGLVEGASSNTVWVTTRSNTDRKKALNDALTQGHDIFHTLFLCLDKVHAEAVKKAGPPRSSTPLALPSFDTSTSPALTITPLRPSAAPQANLLLASSPSQIPFIPYDLVLSPEGETFSDLIDALLVFFDFLLKEVSLPLTWERAKDIWEALMETPQLCCPFEVDRTFTWFEENCEKLSDQDRARLMKDKILTQPPESLSMRGFLCFRKFFETVNERRAWGSSFVKDDPEESQVGLDFLWELSLASPEDALAAEARRMLITTFTRSSSTFGMTPEKAERLQNAFFRACFGRFEAAVAGRRSQTGSALADAARALAASAAASPATSTPAVSSTSTAPDDSGTLKVKTGEGDDLRLIHRLVSTVHAYLSATEDRYHHGFRCAPGHGSRFYASGRVQMWVTVRDENATSFGKRADEATSGQVIQLLSHENETLRSIRERIAARLDLSDEISKIQLYWAGDELSPDRDAQTLHQLNILRFASQDSGCPGTLNLELEAKKKTWSSLRADDDRLRRHSGHLRQNFGTDSGTGNPLFLEAERSLPAVILAGNPAVYELLHEIGAELGAESELIAEEVRELLYLLPQDPCVALSFDALHQSLDNLPFGNLVLEQARGASERPSLASRAAAAIRRRLRGADSASIDPPSPAGSPKPIRPSKPGHSRNPSNTSTASLEAALGGEAKERLRTLLSPACPFRLLYNLEVLSSRLLPTYLDSPAWVDASDFRQAFIDAGGLALLAGLIGKEALPSANSLGSGLRRELLRRLLQLLYFLLCGSSEARDIVDSELGERAANLAIPAVAGASADVKPLDFASLHIPIPQMGKSLGGAELSELLDSLVGLSWSAAAGCLQLRASLPLVSPRLRRDGERGWERLLHRLPQD